MNCVICGKPREGHAADHAFVSGCADCGHPKNHPVHHSEKGGATHCFVVNTRYPE